MPIDRSLRARSQNFQTVEIGNCSGIELNFDPEMMERKLLIKEIAVAFH
jgi:hypothetical protein